MVPPVTLRRRDRGYPKCGRCGRDADRHLTASHTDGRPDVTIPSCARCASALTAQLERADALAAAKLAQADPTDAA